MATMQEHIVAYMTECYEKDKKYKFEATEVVKAVTKRMPTVQRNSISAQLSTMRAKGIIVSLDEKVPGGRKNQSYFALAKILDKVTEPSPVAEKEETVVAKSTDIEPKPISAKLPSQVPANPFDKVFSQLGELLSKVDGLSKGYTEISERQRKHTEALASSEVRLENDDFNAIAVKIVQELISEDSVYIRKINNLLAHQSLDLQKLIEKPVVVGEQVADAVNARLSDFTKDNSFIYHVRNEVDDRVGKSVEGIYHKLDDLKTPENYSSLSDEEKYRQGMRDGIKLAVEMGLILPDA